MIPSLLIALVLQTNLLQLKPPPKRKHTRLWTVEGIQAAAKEGASAAVYAIGGMFLAEIVALVHLATGSGDARIVFGGTLAGLTGIAVVVLTRGKDGPS